jgi:hypothetical protein
MGQPERGITVFMGVPTMYAKLIQYYETAAADNPLLQREVLPGAIVC